MNNYISYISFIQIILSVSLFISCNHDHSKDNHGHDHGDHKDEHEMNSKPHTDHHDSEDADHHDELVLTDEQIKTVGLEFGEFLDIKVNQFVEATGTLGLPPNAHASVSVKAEGIISGNKIFVEGDKISKGEVIAYLSNPEFIILQQEYLETSALLKLKKLDCDRQRKLVEEGAGVVKKLQEVNTDLKILKAKSVSLAKQLNYLGISAKSLTVESIGQSVAVVSPISGFIISIDFHKGMYAHPSVSLMEIIADDHLHLELDIFENDIAKVAIGQKITYSLPALGNKEFLGEVTIINKEFDTRSKTIRIHGHLGDEKPGFIKNLYIKAKIWLNEDTVEALPEDAVIKDGASYYIYAAKIVANAKETSFEKFMIVPGAINDGFMEVKLIDKLPADMKIVTKGAYYVYAQSIAGELEHSH